MIGGASSCLTYVPNSTLKSSLNLKSTILKETQLYAEQFVFMMKMENALGEIDLNDEETYRDD